MSLKNLSQSLIGLIIIGACLLVALFLYSMRPEVKKAIPDTQTTLVDVILAKGSTERITINAFGTVQGEKQVSVKPEVSGRVVEQSPNLVLGGIVKKNEMLLRIDPRDFQWVVEQKEADLIRAEFDLKVEEGKQVIAEREWQLLGPTIKSSELSHELALRKPHLKEKQAAVSAAKSHLAKAKLDLARTMLRAPFNATIIEEEGEIGQYITPQSTVAKIVGIDRFRVQISLPFEQLQFIDLQGNPQVIISQDVGGNRIIERQGKVERLLADVDPQGRMVRILIGIDDPLSLSSTTNHKGFPLLLGTYVRVEIFGPELTNVFRIPRKALHEGNILWVKNLEDKLELREVNIVFREKKDVIIDRGLKAGEEIVISPLPIAIPKMDLRTLGDK